MEKGEKVGGQRKKAFIVADAVRFLSLVIQAFGGGKKKEIKDVAFPPTNC